MNKEHKEEIQEYINSVDDESLFDYYEDIEESAYYTTTDKEWILKEIKDKLLK